MQSGKGMKLEASFCEASKDRTDYPVKEAAALSLECSGEQSENLIEKVDTSAESRVRLSCLTPRPVRHGFSTMCCLDSEGGLCLS